MLPNVSNIDIAKYKRPTHELIVAANSENWESQTQNDFSSL
jgi:hypothetical protein